MADSAAVAEVGHRPSMAPVGLLVRAWHFLVSMRTGVALILCLAILALIGTLVVQTPTSLRGDPEAYAAWLDSVRPRYESWTGALDMLGLFSVFSSVWFEGLVALLSTSIIACSANRAPRLWRRATHPPATMGRSFFDHAPLSFSIAATADPEVALAALESALRTRRFRMIVARDDAGMHVFADRFRWAPFGSLVAHLSLVVILVGVLVGSSLGFRDPRFTAPIGTPVEVGNGTGLTLLARSFSDAYNTQDGTPIDYASDIVLYRDGRPVAAQTIRVNEPLRYDGVTFYQSFFGPSADLKVIDQAGHTAFAGGVPLAWGSSDATTRVGRLSLPAQRLTVFVIGVGSGALSPTIKAGQIELRAYRNDGGPTPIATQVVSQGQAVQIASLEFTFVRERQFSGLIVTSDPGIPLVWGGALALVVGVFVVLFFPCRRAGAFIRRVPGGSVVVVGAIGRHDVAFEAEFRDLVADVRLAVAGSDPREET